MNKSDPIKKILTAAIAVAGLLMMGSGFAAPHLEPSNKVCPNVEGETPHPHYCPEPSTIHPVSTGSEGRYALQGPIRLESPGANSPSTIFKSPPGVTYPTDKIVVLELKCGQTHGEGSRLTCHYSAKKDGNEISVDLVNDNIK